MFFLIEKFRLGRMLLQDRKRLPISVRIYCKPLQGQRRSPILVRIYISIEKLNEFDLQACEQIDFNSQIYIHIYHFHF